MSILEDVLKLLCFIFVIMGLLDENSLFFTFFPQLYSTHQRGIDIEFQYMEFILSCNIQIP